MELQFRLILTVAIFLGVESFCSNGWTRNDDSCYLFEALIPKTWQQADKYCRDQYGHLVTIDSKDENIWLQNEIRKLHPAKGDQYWTDGNDINNETVWIWGHNQQSIQTTFWYPGEPNQDAGGEEDCLTFYSHYHLAWNDENCGSIFPFICEMEDPGLSAIIG